MQVIRIAIVGAGAVGASVGVWLTTRADIDVTFCVRTRFSLLCVETPLGPINMVPKLISDLATAEPVDWIVVATKTYDAPAARTGSRRCQGRLRAWRSCKTVSST
jgi:2-dehydropantoate 2-reductase